MEETPGESKRRSRWDLTPSAATPLNTVAGSVTPSSTPLPGAATPSSFTPSAPGMTPSVMTPGGTTPVGALAIGLKTPVFPSAPMTPDQMAIFKWEREIDERNRLIFIFIFIIFIFW